MIESHPALGIDVGAHIHGDFNYDFGSASYKWWFGHGSDVFGVGLGAADASDPFSDSYHESAWAPMLTFAGGTLSTTNGACMPTPPA